MKIELGFSNKTLCANIPESCKTQILIPNKVKIELMGDAEVVRAIDNPIGTPLIRDIFRAGETVAIVTSDITRPMPSKLVLPILLSRLNDAGIMDKDIVVVFGLGSHRLQTQEEKRCLVGDEIFKRVQCKDSGEGRFVDLGVTKRGTPVEISEFVANADRIICLGNIEFHYFAGYSGGAKAIMPGVSTHKAIQSNHSAMIEPRAFAGSLKGNPVRDDIEEVENFCKIDFIVNVILDEHKKIIKAVAGHHVIAHREGCAFLDSLYKCKISARADIVIASQGGAPKDINLYQTQKALDNAKQAVAENGIIILVGSCKEGMGEEVFEQWMTEASHPSELVERIKREFVLGGHKAAAIALVLEKSEIFLVSELEPSFVKSIFMQPFSTLSEALCAAIDKKGENASIIVMPYGGSTLPEL